MFCNTCPLTCAASRMVRWRFNMHWVGVFVMNDFTKEELHRLYAMAKIFDGKAIFPIRNKLQSMIDNYCEHEWMENQTNVTSKNCIKCAVDRIIK